MKRIEEIKRKLTELKSLLKEEFKVDLLKGVPLNLGLGSVFWKKL